MPPVHVGAGNALLEALPVDEQRQLRSKMTRVRLLGREQVCECDQAIEYVYFPETAVVSVVAMMCDGAVLSVGNIGKEGMTGIRLLFGADAGTSCATIERRVKRWSLTASGEPR